MTARALVKQRRSLKMTARELNDVDRDIFEIRQYIEHQRDVIRQLNDGGHSQSVPHADDALTALQDSFRALQERKRAVLDQLRRPRASSRPGGGDESGRRSGGS